MKKILVVGALLLLPFMSHAQPFKNAYRLPSAVKRMAQMGLERTEGLFKTAPEMPKITPIEVNPVDIQAQLDKIVPVDDFYSMELMDQSEFYKESASAFGHNVFVNNPGYLITVNYSEYEQYTTNWNLSRRTIAQCLEKLKVKRPFTAAVVEVPGKEAQGMLSDIEKAQWSLRYFIANSTRDLPASLIQIDEYLTKLHRFISVKLGKSSERVPLPKGSKEIVKELQERLARGLPLI